MKSLFVLKYICPEDNIFEILGVYSCKDQAVDELLIRANFRERDGRLTQYRRYTDEYPSFNYLRNKVKNEMRLVDEDIYEIKKIPLNEKSRERN